MAEVAMFFAVIQAIVLAAALTAPRQPDNAVMERLYAGYMQDAPQALSGISGDGPDGGATGDDGSGF